MSTTEAATATASPANPPLAAHLPAANPKPGPSLEDAVLELYLDVKIRSNEEVGLASFASS